MQEKDKKAINWAKKRIEQIDNEIEKLIKEKRDLKILCQNLMNVDNVITFKDIKNE